MMSWIFLSAISFCEADAINGSMAGTPSTMVVGLGVAGVSPPSLLEPLPPHAVSNKAADMA
ncbi:hypothetical protein D3C71_2055010 [compost metagenome]